MRKVNVIKLRRFCHSKEKNDLMNSFPEINETKTLIFGMKFSQAFDIYERVYQIMLNATGPFSPSSIFLTDKKVLLLRCMGEYSRAEKIIYDRGFNKKNINPELQIRDLQFISVCKLQRGLPNQSLDLAEKAILLCESSNANIDQFSISYSLKGLSLMYIGDYSESEIYLQKAARWSQTTKNEIISLCNLGALSWFQPLNNIQDDLMLGHSPDSCRSKNIDSSNQQNIIKYSFSKNILSSHDKNDESRPVLDTNNLNLNNSMKYWDDALKVDISNVEDELLAIYKATVVCNVAQVTPAALQDQNTGTMDLLAKTLQSIGPAQGSSDDVHLSTLLLAPTTARVLSLLAIKRAQGQQPVTAEGLFRASLAKFESPTAVSDPRFVLEHALTMAQYGNLLMSWEKREPEGERLLAAARAMLGPAAGGTGDKAGRAMVLPSGHFLSPTVLLPL